jgi:hypothetical protein
MGQSPDNKWLIAGGVFASVQGIPQVYFYDIEDDPYHPLYTGNVDPKGSGITDQVVVDKQGRAIITQVRQVANARWIVVCHDKSDTCLRGPFLTGDRSSTRLVVVEFDCRCSSLSVRVPPLSNG